MSVKAISSGLVKGLAIGAVGLALVPQLGGFKLVLEAAKHASGNAADEHNKPIKSSPPSKHDFNDLGMA